MKLLKPIALALAILVIGAGVVFLWWANTPLPAMPEALAALATDEHVHVESNRWLVFSPRGGVPTTGLVFYPGARVDYRAYAPAARTIASQGYLVVIVPMPLNLAILGGDKAQAVVAAYPTVRHWAIGGHSLGGVMAAAFARRHATTVQGLILWASYPQASDDLSQSALRVTSIYASADGLSTPDKVLSSRPLLPSSTRWVEILGGNHAQFGWYGVQAGDGTATIARTEQQRQVVEATVALLKELQ